MVITLYLEGKSARGGPLILSSGGFIGVILIDV